METKYQKNRNTYKILEQYGGLEHPSGVQIGISSANMEGKSAAAMESPSVGMGAFDATYAYTKPRSFGVNIDEPYYYHATGKSKTEKIKIFNKSGKYAELPDFGSQQAYVGEPTFPNEPKWYCRDNNNILKPRDYVLRFASYNVHNFVKQCLPNPNNAHERGRNIAPCLDILRNLDADIVFLQEIVPYTAIPGVANPEREHAGANFRYITEQFSSIGFQHQFIADTHYSNKPDALDFDKPYFMLCNGIISKHEIIDKKIFELGNNRICMMALFRKNNNLYACFNVHIEYSDRQVDVKNKQPYKFTQMNRLAKIIYDQSLELKGNPAYKNDTIYYVLGGDFNNSYSVTPKLFQSVVNVMGKPLEARIMNDSPSEFGILSGSNQHALIDYFFVAGPEYSNHRDTPTPMARPFYNNHYNIILNSNSDHYPIVYDMIQ